jgi:hypothetical protein
MADDRIANQPGSAADEPLPTEVTAVLASWATSDPPAGFVDRVVAATRQRAAPTAARRHRRSIAAVTLAAVAAAAALVLLRGSGGPGDGTRGIAEGARVVADRETIALGARGVAVAEAGSELTWTVSAARAAEVHQARGDVFYRVEKGGPFLVETPFGQVIVRGTCFRVEVLDMNVARQTWIGGAMGAALAATILITVYEGRIRVVNARGHADARAGERIALGAGAAPERLPTGPSGASGSVAAVEPPPSDTATLDELRRRDQSHRGEIALLRARVQALESPGAAAEAGVGSAHKQGNKKVFDLSQDELVAMAKECELRFDIPGYGAEPRLMDDKLAATANLSAADRAIYDQTVRKENEQYMASLRALYQELAGDAGDNLDAVALYMEILHKSPTADYEAARKQLAEERAGMVARPADTTGHGRSVVERMLRLQSSAGNTLEQLLAAQLGPDKAHQIREAGWAGGDDSILYGCPD